MHKMKEKLSFNETENFEIKLPENSPISSEQLKKLMPSGQSKKSVLYFNDKETLYKGIAQEVQNENAIDEWARRNNH